MNAIRSINLTKLVLLVSFIFFLSCQKQADVSSPTQKSLSDNAFFSRAKISVNLSDRDLVDTIIDFCKRADDISRFSKAVMEKYGYPKWDLTLTLNNENGLKSLMVPVVDTSSQVKLIIFAYQDTKDHVIFKFVGRNTPQPGLPLATNSGKTLTKESLVGIFNALDKRVAASKIQPNSSMENIKSNSYISSLCWLITWHFEPGDGRVWVLTPQCSYQIIITPGNAKGGLADGQIGVVEDIQIGDGGGGGGPNEVVPTKYICDCNCVEEESFENYLKNFEPKWGQIGDISTIMVEIRKELASDPAFSIKPLDEKFEGMAKHFNKNRIFVRNSVGNFVDNVNSQKVDRYVYSKAHGWIDMHHFFYAAQLACEWNRVISYVSLTIGEILQGLIGRSTSSWGYEDMASNALGIDFYVRYKDRLNDKSLSLENAVLDYLIDIKVTKPQEAPNFDFLPHILNDFVPKSKSTKGLIGDELYQAALLEFCKRSQRSKLEIIEAHSVISYSSNK